MCSEHWHLSASHPKFHPWTLSSPPTAESRPYTLPTEEPAFSTRPAVCDVAGLSLAPWTLYLASPSTLPLGRPPLS